MVTATNAINSSEKKKVRKRPVALTTIGFLIKAFIELFLKELDNMESR